MRRACPLLLLGLLAACAGGEAPPAAESPPEATGQEGPPAPEQPTGPDIWVAELRAADDGGLMVGEPYNATERPGYDNQPYFLPDGSGFWYTAIDDSGQADIWRYDLGDRSTARVTATAPESEYSATPLPDGSGFSVIRVEADSTQRLWRFDADGGGAAVVLPDLAPVGYQAWADARTVVVFVLGQPTALQVVDVRTGLARTAAENVGRSLHRIPGDGRVSFAQRVGDGTTEIRALDPATGSSELIVPGVGGRDDHAWTPDGWLLQAEGGVVHAWRSGQDAWTPVVDMSVWGLDLTRLAVSPDGSWIAMVAEPRAAG